MVKQWRACSTAQDYPCWWKGATWLQRSSRSRGLCQSLGLSGSSGVEAVAEHRLSIDSEIFKRSLSTVTSSMARSHTWSSYLATYLPIYLPTCLSVLKSFSSEILAPLWCYSASWSVQRAADDELQRPRALAQRARFVGPVSDTAGA